MLGPLWYTWAPRNGSSYYCNLIGYSSFYGEYQSLHNSKTNSLILMFTSERKQVELEARLTQALFTVSRFVGFHCTITESS